MKARTVTSFNRFGMRRGSGRAPSGRRLAFPLAMIATALGLLFAAAPAFAGFKYDCQITGTTPVTTDEQQEECNGASGSETPGGGLGEVERGIDVDSSDNVWIVGQEGGNSLVNEFSPAGAFLNQSDGTGSWSPSPYVLDLAFGESAGLIYAADSNADDLWGLNASDATYASVDLNSGLGSGCCFIYATADNSGTATDGDIYVGGSDGTVKRVDGSAAAATFSASESYISGNEITGTPDHAFGSGFGFGLVDLTVDANGDLYVVDKANAEIDRFHSSGEFVQAYVGRSGTTPDSVAVDPTNGNVLLGDTAHGVVQVLSSAGTALEEFKGEEEAGVGNTFSPTGLAIDSTGTLYILDEVHDVVAVFSEPTPHTLTVTKAGTGTGTVTSNPTGIECGLTCEAGFIEGEGLELFAAADPGSTFTGWSGPGAASCTDTGPCFLTMPGAATSVTATFTLTDSDGDGVADVNDACPSQAGTEPNGCPPAGGGNSGGGSTPAPTPAPSPAPSPTEIPTSKSLTCKKGFKKQKVKGKFVCKKIKHHKKKHHKKHHKN